MEIPKKREKLTTVEKYTKIKQLIKEAKEVMLSEGDSRYAWAKVTGLLYRTLYDLDPTSFQDDIIDAYKDYLSKERKEMDLSSADNLGTLILVLRETEKVFGPVAKWQVVGDKIVISHDNNQVTIGHSYREKEPVKES